MGVFDRLRASIARRDFKDASAIVPTWQQNVPQYGEVNYYALSRNGYRRNELIFSCVNYRANSAAVTRLKAYDAADAEMPNHPAIVLARRPNPHMTEFDFWQSTIAMSDIGGAARWWKERSRNGRIVALWPLRPDLCAPVPTKKSFIEAYEYTLDGESFTFPAQDVLSFTSFDPLSQFNGWSPAQVAGRIVDVDNAATDYVKLFFQNAAMPQGLLSVKATLQKEQARELKALWQAQYGGFTRWGGVVVLDQNAAYQQLSSSFKDMDFGILDARNESRICMVFGVWPILIGAKVGLDRSTFSNAAEARQSFWQDTMTPLFKHLSDEYALAMQDEFGDMPDMRFDMAGVPALQEIQIARMTQAAGAFTANIITRNEARAVAGLGAIDPPDAPVFAASLTPAPVYSALPGTGAPAPAKRLTKNDAKIALERHAYKRDQIARSYELRFREAAQNVMSAELKRVMREVRGQKAADFDREQLAKALERAVTESRDDWVKEFTPLIEQLIADSVDQMGADFGIGFDVQNPDVQAFIADYVPKFADQVVDTARNELVRDMLQKAYDEGWSIDQLAESIKGKYAQWNDYRSTMIARTETIRSSNAGAFSAMRASGIERKQWLATNDLRTREWHREADAQIVGIDETFHVGKDRMMFPGDPSATPENTINCRCTLVPVL